jgi:hypothetical protein
MAKKKVANLTPDHYKLRIALIPLRAGSVLHIIEKLSMTAITLL